MKKLLLLLFIPLVLGCGSLDLYKDYGTVKGWGYKEMLPSQVALNGETFYEGKLSQGKAFSVGGRIGGDDATYYYNALMQDFGWTREGDEFTGYYTTSIKRGRLYFSLKREVAIYFWPETSFSVYRLTINTKEED